MLIFNQLAAAALSQADQENLTILCQSADLKIEKSEILYQADGKILAYVIAGYKI